jgi:hypothetical protein
MDIDLRRVWIGWLCIWTVVWVISVLLPDFLVVGVSMLAGMVNVHIIYITRLASPQKKLKLLLTISMVTLVVYGLGSLLLEITCSTAGIVKFAELLNFNAGFCRNGHLAFGLVAILAGAAMVGAIISSIALSYDTAREFK